MKYLWIYLALIALFSSCVFPALAQDMDAVLDEWMAKNKVEVIGVSTTWTLFPVRRGGLIFTITLLYKDPEQPEA
jgi:hypothetical protein